MKKSLFLILILFVSLFVIACNKQIDISTTTSTTSTTTSTTTTQQIEDKVTVTFDFDNGMDNQSIEVTKGSKVTQPDNPTKEGFIFIGWFVNEAKVTVPDYIIFKDTTFVARYEASQQLYTVTFDSKEGTPIVSKEVVTGSKISKPINPSKSGYTFIGWYKEQSYQTIWNFDVDVVTTDITLYAKWQNNNQSSTDVDYGAYFESIWATWEGEDILNTNVFYKNTSSEQWHQVDSELIRLENNKPRVDIVGISEGHYDIKIERGNETLFAYDIFTMSHDRSGYAHFKYTEGVGAYKDDGTLKNDAVVVYVTEENKNEIEIEGIKQRGLGWILNNAQYTKSESTTYNLNEALQSISYFNRPIVFRIIGKITTPDGATGYDSYVNGGSKGDNGHMLRIKNANNITIEGIGENTIIEGWGIHFMASEEGKGIGFEVRNLTFDKYPEDALGLEGVQVGANLTAPVQRGWIHNCTFLPGYAANPAESDKGHGDGSLDIKRGEYFTVSYNQFIGAHKTNLIGASDSNLQYHITMHHNLWQNTSSRVPLARQANIHMYNNVFETTDDNINEMSVAQDVRASAYIFSEANYFFGMKNPTKVNDGTVKSYNEVKYSVYNDNYAQVVTDRTTQVNSNNRYANFDTNPEIFYYDPINKVSDVKHLTDAITARAEVAVYSGTYKKYDTPNIDNHYVTNIEPVLITEDVIGGDTKILKQQPLLVFRLSTDAVFTMISGNTTVPPVLVNIYGETFLLGTGEVNLSAGIYVLESAISHGNSKGTSQAKESRVSSYEIRIDSGEAREARINEAITNINSLPDEITYTYAVKDLIDKARISYNNLKEDEKSLVDESKLILAETTYTELGVSFIEELINAIGVVNVNSFNLISNARKAYNEATPEIKQAITNYDVLTEAEASFASFVVDSIINRIAGLNDVNLINVSDKNAILAELDNYITVLASYNLLSQSQKADVTNIDKLLQGIAYLESCLIPFDVIDLINQIELDNITLENSTLIIEAKNQFDNLNEEGKALISNDLVEKLNEAYRLYEELFAGGFTHNFTTDSFDSDFFSFPGYKNTKNITTTYMGEELTIALKLQSATKITFTTTKDNMKLLLLICSEKSNGTIKLNGNVVITGLGVNTEEKVIELGKAGEYVIEKGSNESFIFYIMVF